MQYVFISYSHRDSDIMQVVRDRLRGAGFNVWTDENLQPGTPSWMRAIESALRNSCAVVALLSPDALKSQWVERELIFAEQNEVPVYPLLVRGDERSAVPILLITAQFADARQDLQGAVTKLIGALPAPTERPPEERPEAKRTYIVAQTGAADFRSIAEALVAVPEGAIIKVRPGIYRESLTLNKDVEIIGEGGHSGIVLETTGAHCITMATDRAIVRNLTLRQRSQQSDGKSCVYVPQGQLLLENCDLTSESFCGIEICNAGAAPIIRRCAIHDSARAGVYVHSQGAGLLEGCQIYANLRAGVAIKGGGNPTLRGCRIYEGKGVGVWVYENGAGLLEDCQIYANALAGVEIKKGGNPTLHRCTITRNGKQAIHAANGGKGTVENCDLRGNAGGAWYIDDTSSVRRRNNQE